MRFNVAQQQLNAGTQTRHGAHQGLLDTVAHSGCAALGPVRRHVQMHIDKQSLPSAARCQVVKPNGVVRKNSQLFVNVGQYLGGHRFVRQILYRTPDQPVALPHDVEGDTDGNQRVQPQPVGQRHADEADDHND
jgi:hypothetical protein